MGRRGWNWEWCDGGPAVSVRRPARARGRRAARPPRRADVARPPRHRAKVVRPARRRADACAPRPRLRRGPRGGAAATLAAPPPALERDAVSSRSRSRVQSILVDSSRRGTRDDEGRGEPKAPERAPDPGQRGLRPSFPTCTRGMGAGGGRRVRARAEPTRRPGARGETRARRPIWSSGSKGAQMRSRCKFTNPGG